MTIPLSVKAQNVLDERPWRLKILFVFSRRYREMRRKILLDNAQDKRRSLKLKRALAQFPAIGNVADLSVTEKGVGEQWRPFRVEHNLSGNIRAGLSGIGSGWGKFSFSGDITGTTTPNLLDSSVTIFLKNEVGDTLRAIIPSVATAREMLARTLKQWEAHANREGNHYWDYGSSYTGMVIHRFAMGDGWTEPLEHTKTIDLLDASCEKDLAERPVVRVFGERIRDGIVLASALEVDGKQNVFVPTKFFAALTQSVQKYVRTGASPQLSIAA